METKKKMSKGAIIAIIALVAAIAVIAVVYFVNAPKTSKGAKSVTISVIDNNGAEKSYSAKTDAEYLSQVFDEIKGLTVEGDSSEYGLYITTVNGLTADYSVDSSYWAIYVNGNYGSYGADSQPVADGDSFTLAYEISQW